MKQRVPRNLAVENTTDSSKVSETISSIKDGVRIHTYLTCYIEHPYILLKVSVENCNADPYQFIKYNAH